MQEKNEAEAKLKPGIDEMKQALEKVCNAGGKIETFLVTGVYENGNGFAAASGDEFQLARAIVGLLEDRKELIIIFETAVSFAKFREKS